MSNTMMNTDETATKKAQTLPLANYRYYAFALDLLTGQIKNGIITHEQAVSCLQDMKFFDDIDIKLEFFDNIEFKNGIKNVKEIMKLPNTILSKSIKDYEKSIVKVSDATEKASMKETQASGTPDDKKLSTEAKRSKTALATAVAKSDTLKGIVEDMKTDKVFHEAFSVFLMKHMATSNKEAESDDETSVKEASSEDETPDEVVTVDDPPKKEKKSKKPKKSDVSSSD